MNNGVYGSLFFNITLMTSFLYAAGRIRPFHEGLRSKSLFFLYSLLNASILSILCIIFPLYKSGSLQFDLRSNPIVVLGMGEGFFAAFLSVLISGVYDLIAGGGPLHYGMIINYAVSVLLGGTLYYISRMKKRKVSYFCNLNVPLLVFAGIVVCAKDYIIYKYLMPEGNALMYEMGMLMPAAQVTSILIMGIVIKDNVRLYQQNCSLKEEAMTDELTGLKNYRYIVSRVYRLISDERKKFKHISFMMIDIDRFKNYNDTFGHLEGNNVLKSLSTILMDSIREGDIVARYGGEEFLIILRGVNIRGAYKIAERIRKNVYDMGVNFGDPANKKRITISVGISCYPYHGSDALELIGNADKALYRAKEMGRNNVQVYGKDDISYLKNNVVDERRDSSI